MFVKCRAAERFSTPRQTIEGFLCSGLSFVLTAFPFRTHCQQSDTRLRCAASRPWFNRAGVPVCLARKCDHIASATACAPASDAQAHMRQIGVPTVQCLADLNLHLMALAQAACRDRSSARVSSQQVETSARATRAHANVIEPALRPCYPAWFVHLCPFWRSPLGAPHR